MRHRVYGAEAGRHDQCEQHSVFDGCWSVLFAQKILDEIEHEKGLAICDGLCIRSGRRCNAWVVSVPAESLAYALRNAINFTETSRRGCSDYSQGRGGEPQPKSRQKKEPGESLRALVSWLFALGLLKPGTSCRNRSSLLRSDCRT